MAPSVPTVSSNDFHLTLKHYFAFSACTIAKEKDYIGLSTETTLSLLANH